MTYAQKQSYGAIIGYAIGLILICVGKSYGMLTDFGLDVGVCIICIGICIPIIILFLSIILLCIGSILTYLYDCIFHANECYKGINEWGDCYDTSPTCEKWGEFLEHSTLLTWLDREFLNNL